MTPLIPTYTDPDSLTTVAELRAALQSANTELQVMYLQHYSTRKSLVELTRTFLYLERLYRDDEKVLLERAFTTIGEQLRPALVSVH